MANLLNQFIALISRSSKNESTMRNEGIITLADHNYFQGLIILYHSAQASYSVPIVCYDIGLKQDQKAWCKINLPLLTILPIPEDHIIKKIQAYKETKTLAKKGKRQWALWICPFLIQHSPFVNTLWLDCDLIVLRNLKELFLKIDDGAVFTPENLAPDVTPNKPELYHLLPINRQYNEKNALINAGVSGWHMIRDKHILADYAKVVEQAFENEKIKNAISWHDQGALIWTILNNNLEDNVENNWIWNQCVKHTAAKNMKFTWSSEKLAEIQKIVPDANILHWNGQSVPWN